MSTNEEIIENLLKRLKEAEIKSGETEIKNKSDDEKQEILKTLLEKLF